MTFWGGFSFLDRKKSDGSSPSSDLGVGRTQSVAEPVITTSSIARSFPIFALQGVGKFLSCTKLPPFPRNNRSPFPIRFFPPVLRCTATAVSMAADASGAGEGVWLVGEFGGPPEKTNNGSGGGCSTMTTTLAHHAMS